MNPLFLQSTSTCYIFHLVLVPFTDSSYTASFFQESSTELHPTLPLHQIHFNLESLSYNIIAMDLVSLASTVQAQMEQITILQDELKKKESIQDDLIKRLESMEIDPLLHDPNSKSKKAGPSKGKSKNRTSPPKPPKPALKPLPSSRSVKQQSTSTGKFKTPEKPSQTKSALKSSSAKASTSKELVLSPKRNENQMIMKEAPEGFKPTKVCHSYLRVFLYYSVPG